MIKIFNILGLIIIIILALIVIVSIALTINHIKKLRKESKEYPPPGKMIEVNGKKLHIYTEGQGDSTLVFMAGHGTSSPTLDFKPLWMRMTDEYRIAVIERSGYGWSETSDSSRDIYTILNETRKVLELAGEKGPYVLVAHSMSGLEAICWAQRYPDEVEAIIGLDPCTPGTFNILPKPKKIQLYIMYIISRIGLSRYMPNSELEVNLPLIKSEDFTKKDKEKYLTGFYKNAFSKDMLREVNYLKDNSETVSKEEVPSNTPIYFFISHDQEANVNGWEEILTKYLSKIYIGKYMKLDTSHYMHYDKSNIIAKETKAFLKDIK